MLLGEEAEVQEAQLSEAEKEAEQLLKQMRKLNAPKKKGKR